jgi:hypothetical protein
VQPGIEARVSEEQRILACRFFRGTALGRRAHWLALFIVLFNLFAPLSWVATHEASAHTALCLASAAGTDHERGGPAGDPATPVHCPLCLVLAGSIAAPPSTSPLLVLSREAIVAPPHLRRDLLAAALPARLHPAPRGPPLFA